MLACEVFVAKFITKARNGEPLRTFQACMLLIGQKMHSSDFPPSSTKICILDLPWLWTEYSKAMLYLKILELRFVFKRRVIINCNNIFCFIKDLATKTLRWVRIDKGITKTNQNNRILVSEQKRQGEDWFKLERASCSLEDKQQLESFERTIFRLLHL